MMPVIVITPPTAEPIDRDTAKHHLRIEPEITDDDMLINSMIVAARQSAEHITGLALMRQTIELAMDCFPEKICLPRPPFVSITSVKYIDLSGNQITMSASDYLLDSHSVPARIVPAYGTIWPSTRDQINAVLVRYEVGYANAAAVPDEIKNWMLLRIGSVYENRESFIAGMTLAPLPFVDRMLDAYKVWVA